MISVAGTLVADLLVRPVRNWEGKGHNANVDCIELLPGGTVANTGFALTRLGLRAGRHRRRQFQGGR
jgi:sugar/nucleoside kinase (ribokinase family)